jgi:hypothetical protein
MENRITGNWIAVSERLPADDALYLVYAPSADPAKPLITTAWFEPDGFGWSLIVSYWIKAITHWMPLPEPPRVLEVKKRRKPGKRPASA